MKIVEVYGYKLEVNVDGQIERINGKKVLKSEYGPKTVAEYYILEDNTEIGIPIGELIESGLY